MKILYKASLLAMAVCSSTASAQGWIKWEGQATQPTQQTAQPTQQSAPAPAPAPVEVPAAQSRATTIMNSPTSFDKAECDAAVATAYPVNLWAPGLGKKREELFAACMARRANPASVTSPSPSMGKAECDAKVATAYPVNLWAPGLSKKRKELFAACMANN